jgi:hypothetical protein
MTQGTSPVLDYLTRLHEDTDLQSRYWADPEGELERAGLDDEQRAAILSGDPQQIREIISQETGEEFQPTVLVQEHVVELGS